MSRNRKEFGSKVKWAAWQRCKGLCEGAGCGLRLSAGRFAYDHIIPDGLGGEPTVENCQVLCAACHQIKTGTKDVPAIAKTVRLQKRAAGIKKPRSILGWQNFKGEPVKAPRER